MSKIDPRHLATAFVRPGTPMLSELLRRIAEHQDLTPTRRRDLASGLRRVAKALRLPPEEVPADPRWLRPRLTRLAPAALGLSAKSWSNARSDAQAALALFGITERRVHRVSDLSPAWRALWDAVLASKDASLHFNLSRFVYFLNKLDVAPEDVGVEHAGAFKEALVRNEISKCPEALCRNAVCAWNLAVKRLPTWPRQTLAQPTPSNRFKRPLADFPASFRRDLDRFAARMTRPDPLDPDALPAPLRPATVRKYRGVLERFASALAHAGTPMGEIDGLAALVSPARAELGLRWLLKRGGGLSSPGVAETAEVLKVVAKRHVRAPESERKAVERLARRLAVKKPPGMTAKNRERLRPLMEKPALRRLLRLPDRLFERAEASGDTRAAALEREDAIAVAILLTAPIRLRNLAEIRLDRHLHRPGDGSAFLVFRPDEVKNSQLIEFPLAPETLRMIDRHLATRSPHLCPAGTPWLFPKRTGDAPIHKVQLAGRIKKRTWREVGVPVNVHLFRHLAATLLLRARPGAYETVRHLLGHTRLSPILDAYAGFEAGSAVRSFAEVVEAERRG